MLMSMGSPSQTVRKHHFAVGASNVCNSLLPLTVMEYAEEQHAPVIAEFAPLEFSYAGSDFFAYAVKWMQNSNVPCVPRSDHGKVIQDCICAIRYGFTSIMIDGLLLACEGNARLTKTVVELAHGVDVSVEGGIETIGALSDSVEGGVEQVTYTKPEEVTDLLTKMNADTPAAAIGIAHGVYPKGFVPRLRLDILKAIEKVSTYPLVLHRGPVNRDEKTTEVCRHGIYKVNIASDVRKAFFRGTKEMLIETDTF